METVDQVKRGVAMTEFDDRRLEMEWQWKLSP